METAGEPVVRNTYCPKSKSPEKKNETENPNSTTSALTINALTHKLMNTTSQERIIANRANALKSTGPKTSGGKAASKMNAVKHGILSREVLVAGEDEQELNALQEWFQEDLQPVGPMELMLVGQIVATHWRLRRILAAESDEIKREAKVKELSANSNALQPPLEDTAEGCRLLQTWLNDTMLAVEKHGELNMSIVGEFSARVGHRSSSVKCKLMKLHFQQRLKQRNDKQEVITFLNESMSQLAEQEARCQKKEEKGAKALQTFAVLPSAEALEKLGRYESMLNRQLFRAMKELRTLQKERKEQNPKSESTKSERNSKAEVRERAILPNEAIAQSAVQSSESKVQSSSELPNEPIGASELSEISNLRSQMAGNLRNEPTNEGVK